MKRSQLAILILLVVVFGAVAFLLLRNSTTSWQSGAGQSKGKVVDLPINDVAQITIQQPTSQVNLKMEGDTWVVTERANYPANFEMISTLIRSVWSLKPVQEIKVGPSQLGRLDLLPPAQGANAGTLVDFKNAEGKRLVAVLLGKKYLRDSGQAFAQGRTFPAGRYVMPEDGLHRVSLVTETFQQIDEKPERWLDRAFIKIEKPTSIAVAGQDAGMNWKLERVQTSTEWKLMDAKPDEQLDGAKAKQIASTAGNLSSFTDVVPSDQKSQANLDKPTTVTVTTEDGFTYVLRVGEKKEESYPLTVSVSAELPSARVPANGEKPEDKARLDKEFTAKHETLEKKLAKEKKLEGHTFLVPKFGIEQLEKNRADLLASKTTPTPSPAPSASKPPKVDG